MGAICETEAGVDTGIVQMVDLTPEEEMGIIRGCGVALGEKVGSIRGTNGILREESGRSENRFAVAVSDSL